MILPMADAIGDNVAGEVLTHRTFLGSLGTATLAAEREPTVAAIISEFRHRSHADVICTRTFDGLAHVIEEFVVTGKPLYPVERTLLVTGVLAF